MMATMKRWASDGIHSSGWLLWAPLLAAYAPRDLPKMYFNLHLRRYARRLVPFLDPFVTIDIVSKSSKSGEHFEYGQCSDAYKEVKAYLTKLCSRDALAFRAHGTIEGRSFLLNLRQGQEVTDHFQGVTVWWLLMPRSSTSASSAKGCLRLMFPQRHRALIVDQYLPHVRRQGREDMLVTIDIVSTTFGSDCGTVDSDSGDVAFNEVKAYLSSACSRDALNLRAQATVKGDSFFLSLRKGAVVADDRFRDVTLWWFSVPTASGGGEAERLRLMFPQQHRVLILDEYLPHIRRQGRNVMFGERRQSLYTNKRGFYGGNKVWNRMDFGHPATLDSLAMHPNKKRKIMEDLDSFRGNKDYYRRIGKPWKRGYLLYGPPGTGKSTMIAAMANYLNYDIYDIELTSVSNNSDLRNLVINTTSKSIIVIEDIDCCFDDFNGQRTKNKKRSITSGWYENKEKVTMSGLLNFIDGVWSAQNDERIIVLTTNFPEKLDPAMTRRGRMDMRIEMSYCCFEAFKMLARNYLAVEAHPLFRRVEELLQVVEIIPADVAECLLKDESSGSDRGVETCLRRLIDELEKKAQEVKSKAAAKPKRQRRR